MSTLALDVGATTLRAARVQGGQVTWRAERPSGATGGPEQMVQNMLDLLSLAPSGSDRLGVAMTGRVAGGRVTAMNRETLPGWDDYPLQEQLAGALNLPVSVLNDARAAAWGEFTRGAGRGTTQFLFVTVSTGVGAGLVLGGQLHLAPSGLDAELGFTLVPGRLRETYRLPHLPPLSELEFEASGSALDAHARERYGGARQLADAAEAGDEAAEALYGRSASLLAWRASDLRTLLGVERVALGGSVGLRDGYRQRVLAALDLLPEGSRPEVLPAALGADAGLVGAAEWAERK